MNIDLLTNNALVLVPLVLAVTQGFKMILPNMSKWAPLVAIAVGIVFAWVFYTGDVFNFRTVFGQGIISGLSASGLFSGIKATAHATTGTDNIVTGDEDRREP